MADDGMQLEVISVRFPTGDPDFNTELWNKIDEQQLPLGLRRDLADNGLRVGVLYGELPPVIAQQLAAAESTGRPALPRPLLDWSIPPRSAGRKCSCTPAGTAKSSRPAFTRNCRFGCMKTDNSAAAPIRKPRELIDAQVQALGDHRIKLHLTPELQYGEPLQQFVVEDGVLRPQTAKPKRVFDRLAFDTALAQDQMLLVTCLPDRTGTLGYNFFTEQRDGQPQQKLVVIRLAESRYSDLFVPSNASEAKMAAKPTSLK